MVKERGDCDPRRDPGMKIGVSEQTSSTEQHLAQQSTPKAPDGANEARPRGKIRHFWRKVVQKLVVFCGFERYGGQLAADRLTPRACFRVRRGHGAFRPPTPIIVFPGQKIENP